MIDWAKLNPWAQAEYCEASDGPRRARERVARCGGRIESEWTLEEKYGVTAPGSRELRFTVVLGARRFTLHPAIGGRYRATDLGRADDITKLG